MYGELAIIALFTFLYSIVAGRFERSIISGPMVFVIVGFILGPYVLGLLHYDMTRSGVRVLADLTLALVLFCDASNANMSILRKQVKLPSRMLLFGLPGAILFGTLIGAVIFSELTIFEAAILATILGATDAALGKAVVSNPTVPGRLREGLNIESGLNDGLCVPILFVFIALAEGSVEGRISLLAIELVGEELGIGLIVGLTITSIGAFLFLFCRKRGWVTEIWSQTIVLSLALSCFFFAQTLHGSGYIAAFSGGLLFGFLVNKDTHKLVLAAEGMSEILALLTWTFFGAVIIGKAYEAYTWTMIVYAILSLTIVRMLPIFLALSGTGQNVPSKMFLGWFGPRGLASIVFAVIVLEKNLPGGKFISMAVVCTVLMSLVAHGISAVPLANWIGKKGN